MTTISLDLGNRNNTEHWILYKWTHAIARCSKHNNLLFLNYCSIFVSIYYISHEVIFITYMICLYISCFFFRFGIKLPRLFSYQLIQLHPHIKAQHCSEMTRYSAFQIGLLRRTSTKITVSMNDQNIDILALNIWIIL